MKSLCITLALVTVAGTARAAERSAWDDVADWFGPVVQSGRSMVTGHSVYVGYAAERGFGEAAAWENGAFGTPRLNGITYWERQGIITGILGALITVIGGSAQQMMPKSVKHEDIGNIRYTTITYYSEEEKRQIREDADRRAQAISSASDQSFEITVFSRNLPGEGDATGYRVNAFFGIPLGESGMLDLGFGMSRIDAFATDLKSGEKMEIESLNVGVPARLSWGFRYFVLYGQFDWNIAAHVEAKADKDSLTTHLVRNHPLRLGAQSNLFGRLFVDASAVTPNPKSLEFGWRVVAGMRF